MVDRPKFPIPSELTPDTFCLCLQIPNNDDWKRVFVGLLAQPTYWFNWQSDDDHSGKTLSQYWTKIFDEIDWSTMSCCCETPEIRINADGSVSVSFDHGATWETNNSYDPRYTSPQFPPLTGDDGDDKKCKAANNAVQQLKDFQAGNAGNIGTVTTVLQMAALAVGLAIAVFAQPELVPFLISLFFELAGALLGTTETAYNALFDDDVWSYALCQFYCNMADDGTFSQTNFSAISANFDSHYSGTVALTLTGALLAWQLPGLNNAARIASTSDLDCSGCDCNPPAVSFYTPLLGWFTMSPTTHSAEFDTYLVTSSTSVGDMENRISILGGQTPSTYPGTVCVPIRVEPQDSPAPDFRSTFDCSGTESGSHGMPVPDGNYTQVDLTNDPSNPPFTVKFTVFRDPIP